MTLSRASTKVNMFRNPYIENSRASQHCLIVLKSSNMHTNTFHMSFPTALPYSTPKSMFILMLVCWNFPHIYSRFPYVEGWDRSKQSMFFRKTHKSENSLPRLVLEAFLLSVLKGSGCLFRKVPPGAASRFPQPW